MSMSDYLEQKLLQHVFMNTPYTAPSVVYAALYTSAPSDVGTDGTEVNGGSYARQPVSFALGATGAGTVTNAAAITWTALPACTVVSAALFDAPTGGNMLEYADLPTPITYTAGDNATAAVGALAILLG